MANILYGVNGEGAGHSTRAREVLVHLRSQGHDVVVASFDRGLQNLSPDFEVIEIYGFRFAYVNNQVRYRRTVVRNLATLPQAAASVKQLRQVIKESRTDVVITDFEPLTCYVGHHARLPVISIDNQHCLTNTKVSYPRQHRRDAALARLVTRLMVSRAEAYLVTSFIPAPVKKRRTFVFPPILRHQILSAVPREGKHVLVYVTSPAPALCKVLNTVPSEFIAYGFGREGREGNVVYKKPSLNGFFLDLVNAKAIIANAGFSLVTEALHLAKPYLAIPVQHQFEQIFNAYWLQKMGYGVSGEGELTRRKVEAFLDELPQFRARLAAYPRQGNGALLSKLDSLISECTSRSSAARSGR